MGRGKLSLKLMRNERARVATLKKRLKGLKKKAYEFSVLCDVKVCVIVFEPKTKNSPPEVEVWPSNPVEVKTIINQYKTKAASGVQKKIFGIFDYFNLRNRQIHDELAQVRKANFKAKFPTWDDRINGFSPGEIASFLTEIDFNLEVVRRKMMMTMRSMRDEQGQLMESSKSIANPKPLNYVQEPLFSPAAADDSLVKLSLSLNHMENSAKVVDYRVLSRIASNSGSLPNHVMYNPNNVSMLCPTSVPVVHHDPSPAMQNDVDPRTYQTCFYVPPMQPDPVAYFNPQPFMLPPAFHQMQQINPYYVKNNEERF